MIATGLLRLDEVECRVCDIASEQLNIPRDRIKPGDRLIEDLGCDSLAQVELLMEVEDTFNVHLPDDEPNAVYKSVFTRPHFRLADLAELVYLRQGTGAPERKDWRRARKTVTTATTLPFTQLDGRWDGRRDEERRIWEPLNADGPVSQYRRRTDGMRCALIPSSMVEIGCDGPDALHDETPKHVVEIDAFLIDFEPVSTTAYCRFLNSIGEVAPEVLDDWFVLDDEDTRNIHVLILRDQVAWRPVSGSERWPMILVSWFGANAYSLWANGNDWRGYRIANGTEPECFLPTEAQWEYAARGAFSRKFPWGDDPPSPDRMCYARHRKGASYRVHDLPPADVNAELGMSPFGLHHMAGNVWQWCRDWYDETFYSRPESIRANPLNLTPGTARVERGGSWIGPAELCRSSFRRGRTPWARGRCLGFRCVGKPPQDPKRSKLRRTPLNRLFGIGKTE
ncbi:MAG: hypothetical protein NVSMB14_02440 [Isosphaeraceae bacterium]